jgi:primosomal protein N' (replication factor Y)
LRASVVGSERTAEEFGRAFPGIPIRSSSGDHILREVDGRPAIIVATSGATPMAADGYAAAILLDASAMLARPDLHASEETFAKWMECVSLVRPGGEVVVVAEPDRVEVQALIRHDPVGFATREMQLRSEVQLPPAVRLIALTGTSADIDDLLSSTELPEGVVKRGPVPTREGQVRILLSTPRATASELVAVIKGATASRSARKKGAPVNVRVDPYDI